MDMNTVRYRTFSRNTVYLLYTENTVLHTAYLLLVLVELRWYSDKATGWTVWGLDPARGNGLLSSLKHSDQLCGPLTLLFNGYKGSNPLQGGWGGSDQSMKLSIHLPLVLRLRMGGATTMLPLYAIMTWRGTCDSFLLYLDFYLAYLLHVFVTQITTQKFKFYSVYPFGTVVPFVK